MTRTVSLLLCACLIAACSSVGPDHRRPEVEVPAEFAEGEGWKRSASGDPPRVDGPWWTVFGDRDLDALVGSVAIGNQTVAAFEAQYRQALAALSAARAPQGPTVSASVSGTRGRNATALSPASANLPVTEFYRKTLGISGEADLWGRIRRSVGAGQATLQASSADVRAATLSAQATLVQAWLALRVNEAQQRLWVQAEAAFERSLQITRHRYDAGVAPRSDVTQARTQLLNARAQAIDLQVQRAQLAHAIAVLAGRPPSAVRIASATEVPGLPILPSVLPSEVLQRRPDILAAERRVAAANAQIGVARAAFYPTLTLGASGGMTGIDVANLASLPYRFWSLGPSMAAALFDNGLRAAQTAQAVAHWERAVAQYRQAVLTAFQEVEDALSTLRILAAEAQVQATLVASARETLALIENQYLAGTVSYLNVVTAQTTLLSAQRAALDIEGRRLAAALALMRATGGEVDATSGAPR